MFLHRDNKVALYCNGSSQAVSWWSCVGWRPDPGAGLVAHAGTSPQRTIPLCLSSLQNCPHRGKHLFLHHLFSLFCYFVCFNHSLCCCCCVGCYLYTNQSMFYFLSVHSKVILDDTKNKKTCPHECAHGSFVVGCFWIVVFALLALLLHFVCCNCVLLFFALMWLLSSCCLS